jgi:hypothetical protein
MFSRAEGPTTINEIADSIRWIKQIVGGTWSAAAIGHPHKLLVISTRPRLHLNRKIARSEVYRLMEAWTVLRYRS